LRSRPRATSIPVAAKPSRSGWCLPTPSPPQIPPTATCCLRRPTPRSIGIRPSMMCPMRSVICRLIGEHWVGIQAGLTSPGKGAGDARMRVRSIHTGDGPRERRLGGQDGARQKKEASLTTTSISVAETPIVLYALRRADDALILGHRLSQWCGHAPMLEEDMALTNIGLDLIGQARLLYTYVAELEGGGRDEDSYAYLRDAPQYRNLL